MQLFSDGFWTDLWSKTESSLHHKTHRQMLFYSVKRDGNDVFWSVNFVPLSENVLETNRADIERATSAREQVLVMVAHHNDPTLANLFGTMNPAWMYVYVVMLNQKIIYTRSVFRMEFELLAPEQFARLYLLSRPLKNPRTVVDFFHAEQQLLESQTSIFVRGAEINRALILPNWLAMNVDVDRCRCESTESFLRGYVGLVGPSSTAAAQMDKLKGLDVLCSLPDRLPRLPMCPVQWRDYNARFRWPFVHNCVVEFFLATRLAGKPLSLVFSYTNAYRNFGSAIDRLADKFYKTIAAIRAVENIKKLCVN